MGGASPTNAVTRDREWNALKGGGRRMSEEFTPYVDWSEDQKKFFDLRSNIAGEEVTIRSSNKVAWLRNYRPPLRTFG